MILRAQGKHFSFIARQLRLHRQHSVSYVLKLIIFYILKESVLFPSFKTRVLKRKRDVRHCMVSQVSQMNESRARGGGIRLFHKVGVGEKKGVSATVVTMQHDKVSQNSGAWNTSAASLYTGLQLCIHDCSRLWVGPRMHTGTKPTLDIFHLLWTSMDKWLKQVLSDTQPPGLLSQSKIKCKKNLELLKTLLRCKKKKKKTVMIWEIWFSPNNLPDLTPLLLPPKYTFRWVSELCLLLQVYKYMAKLIIQKKKGYWRKKQK